MHPSDTEPAEASARDIETNVMNIAAYLQRIGYNGSRSPNAANLSRIHLAHLLSVPFENLDIHLGRPIMLDLPRLFGKILLEKRGGFCYELNGLFAWLLQGLGFGVTYLSARVAHDDGSFGPEFDHMILLVRCPADAAPETRWLADVGFGDSFRQPLQLDLPGDQEQGARTYRIASSSGERTLWQRAEDNEWKQQYRFALQPRQYAEFAGMCRYHQTSPRSSFTQHRICSLATPDGRISLDDQRLIVTKHGKRTETMIDSPDEYRSLLENRFGMTISWRIP